MSEQTMTTNAKRPRTRAPRRPEYTMTPEKRRAIILAYEADHTRDRKDIAESVRAAEGATRRLIRAYEDLIAGGKPRA